MQIYLPIAEISVNIFVLLGAGGAVGFLSGMFGVGGGFLMTPLLIFMGIPPIVAVATEANQIVASSMSGIMGHWKRNAVDVKLGLVLLAGGIVGSNFGVKLVAFLRTTGQLDVVISILYVVFLGIVGSLMLIESVKTMSKSRKGATTSLRKAGSHTWLNRLPLKMRFTKSHLYSSVIPIILLGVLVGILAAIMGVGGGFIMVPAMIYLLKVPTNVVVGTSLFQILFMTAYTTIDHSVQNQTVDVALALLLIIGSVIGAQFGVKVGYRLKGEQLRALLALIVLAVCIRLLFGLVLEPNELYSISFAGGH